MDFNEELCNERHIVLATRVTDVEKKLSDNLEKIYKKLEENYEMFITLSGKPGWATVIIISSLTALSTGLIVAMVK